MLSVPDINEDPDELALSEKGKQRYLITLNRITFLLNSDYTYQTEKLILNPHHSLKRTPRSHIVCIAILFMFILFFLIISNQALSVKNEAALSFHTSKKKKYSISKL